jgi:prepilin-type N-terminal cleavage/methylation domain-containing protein
MNKNNLQIKSRGFTLVEIMVATSIFTVIMLIAIGSLVVASDSAKKSQALQSAMDNVNFAVDSMTRSLRMGTHYSCITTPSLVWPSDVNDCIAGGGGIAFIPASDLSSAPDTAYIANALARGDGTTALQRCDKAASSCIDMVANNVDVKTLKFFVRGAYPYGTDYNQPSVYIIMKGTITIKGQPSSFAIQTMASQRTSE